MHAFYEYTYCLQDGKGRISLSDLTTACWQYSLPTEPELLAQVMDYCDVDRDGYIDYLEFSNFLNINMPSGVTEAEVCTSIASAQFLVK